MFSYAKDIGFLRYMYERKNINQLLTIELIFIILASLIVYTNQPLNWIVALVMIFHVFGVVWLVAFPDSFYSMYEEFGFEKSFEMQFGKDYRTYLNEFYEFLDSPKDQIMAILLSK